MSYVGVPYRKYVMSRLYYSDAFIVSFKLIFAFVFAVESDGVTKQLSLYWIGGLSLWENFSFPLRADSFVL